MVKLFLYVFVILFFCVKSALAEHTIVSKFGIGSPPNLVLRYIVDEFNKTQNNTFKLVYLPGGQGRLADQYAIDQSRSKNILWFGGLSTFTIDTLETKKDRIEDFVLLSTITKSEMVFAVKKDSVWNDLKNFVEHNKNTNIFFATLSRSTFPVFLNYKFTNDYHMKPKTLKFSNYGEIALSLDKNESTYTIMPKGSISNIKTIHTFEYSGNTLFAIPKNNLEHKSFYLELIHKICSDQSFIEFSKKLNYEIACLKDKDLYELRTREVELYKRFFN